jgi:hypothetical protein
VLLDWADVNVAVGIFSLGVDGRALVLLSWGGIKLDMGDGAGSFGGVSCKSASLGVFLMFKGRVSGNALKGAGDGDRWMLRGPAGWVAIRMSYTVQ